MSAAQHSDHWAGATAQKNKNRVPTMDEVSYPSQSSFGTGKQVLPMAKSARNTEEDSGSAKEAAITLEEEAVLVSTGTPHHIRGAGIETQVRKIEHQLAVADTFTTLVVALSLDKTRNEESATFVYHETEAEAQIDGASDRFGASENTSIQSLGRQSIKLSSPPGIIKRMTKPGHSPWDEEKNRPLAQFTNAPPKSETWLCDLCPDSSTVSVVEFCLDISGDAEFDIAAHHVHSEIMRYLVKHKDASIVFILHGFAALLGQLILAQKYQQSIVLHTAAVVNFADPMADSSTSEALRQWTSSRLGHNFEESRVLHYSNFVQFLGEHDVPVHTTRKQPLPTGSSNSNVLSQSFSTAAMFHGPSSKSMRKLRRLVLKDVDNHRIISAAKTGNRSAMKMLVDVGHNAVDLKGRNALQIAVLRVDLTMVRLLVHSRRFEEYLGHQDAQGNTALHHAIKLLGQEQEDRIRSIIVSLFERGASRIVKNHDGESAMDLARNIEWLSEILSRSQVVRGHLVPTLSKRGEPPGSLGETACKMMEMTCNIISMSQFEVKISEEAFSVLELLYGKETPRCFSHKDKDTACVWFHGPLNNMAWINDIFFQLQLRTWPWTSESHARHFPHSRSMPAQLCLLKDGQIDSEILSITMPYISYQRYQVQSRQAIFERQTWEATQGMNRQPNSTNDITSSSRFGETVEEIGYMNSVAAYLSHNRNGHDLVLHPRRTLDQSYYYMLRDTSYRDCTQVVSRWNDDCSGVEDVLERKLHSGAKDYNVLMVDQCWLWKIPPNEERQHAVIVTNFPGRLQSANGEQDNLRHRILRETRSYPLGNPNGLIARILSMLMGVFVHSDNESLQFLRFFETAIGSAEEDLSLYFRKFRMYAERLYSLHEDHRDYQKRRSIYLKRLLDIREESQLLVDVKDILDEIKMVDCVLEDQKKVLSQGLQHFLGSDKEAGSYFESLEVQRLETSNRFKNMKDHAKSVETGILELMDLKQKQGRLWEARFAREDAEESSKQGNTLMIFTTVSIVFLPLSFISSFFAISIDSFPRDPEVGDIKWPMWLLCAWLFGISAALIVPLLILAYKVQDWLVDPWFKIRHIYLMRLILFLIRPLSGRFAWAESLRARAWTGLVNHSTVTTPPDIQELLTEGRIFSSKAQETNYDEYALLWEELENPTSLPPMSTEEILKMPRDERQDYERYEKDRSIVVKLLKKEKAEREARKWH